MSVERFNPDQQMETDPNGIFVQAKDYDALAADFKEAEFLIDELRDFLENDVDDHDGNLYVAALLKKVKAFLHKDDVT